MISTSCVLLAHGRQPGLCLVVVMQKPVGKLRIESRCGGLRRCTGNAEKKRAQESNKREAPHRYIVQKDGGRGKPYALIMLDNYRLARRRSNTKDPQSNPAEEISGPGIS
jgi:hypothetical protein